jgi:tetratricopeptide (TPR) repeat protein
VKKLLRITLQRYAADWEAMRQVESLADQIGEKKLAQDALRAMTKAVEADTTQLEMTHLLLLQSQRESEIKALLKHILKPPLAPLPAVVASSWALRPWDSLRGVYQDISFLAEKSAQKDWKKQSCPKILRVLQAPKGEMQIARFLAQKPAQRLHFHALRFACGAQDKGSQAALVAVEKELHAQEEGIQEILSIYIQHQLHSLLIASLRRQNERFDAASLVALFKPMLQGRLAERASEALLAVLESEKKDASPLLRFEALIALCERADICMRLQKTIDQSFQMTGVPPQMRLRLLERLSKISTLAIHLPTWLKQIQAAARDDLLVQDRLAMRPAFFQISYRSGIPYAQIRKIRDQLTTIWAEALIQSLSLREIEPSNLTQWQQTIRAFLSQLQSAPQIRDALFTRLHKATRRFAPIHRAFLLQAVGLYAYRPSLQKVLATVLSGELRWEEALWLERLYQSIPIIERQRILQKAIQNPHHTEESLRVLAFFANQQHLPDIQSAILQHLLKIRPKDPDLLYRAALLLQSLGKSDEAEALWMRYLAIQPQKRQPSYFQRIAKQCCADDNDQALLQRLLLFHLKHEDIDAIWKAVMAFLPRLDEKKQDEMLAVLTLSPRIKAHHLRDLARMTNQAKRLPIALALYQRLAKDEPQQTEYARSLAEILDKLGRYQDAYPHWLASLAKKSKEEKEVFFLKEAQSLQSTPQTLLASIFYYRAFALQAQSPETTEKAFKEAIEAKQPLQAWARWLLLGKHAAQCLSQHDTAIKSHRFLPQKLWSLGLPYQGFLFAFSPCQWSLHAPEQRDALQHLATFLKKHPQQSIALNLSADPDTEPDTKRLLAMRKQAVLDHLTKLGIAAERITLTHPSPERFCQGETLPARDAALSCSVYRRQVAIGKSLPFQLFLTQDADGDGIPDLLDECPFQKLYTPPSRSSAYAYRPLAPYHRRGRMPLTLHPTKPGHHFTTHTYPKDHGCPNPPRPSLRPLKDDKLRFLIKPAFYGYSYTLTSQSQETIAQIAALLKASPHIGKLQVTITPVIAPKRQSSPPPSYGSRRYHYRRRPYQPYYARDYRMLTQRRLAFLRSLFSRYRVPTERLEFIQKEAIEKPGATAYTEPILVWRLIPPAKDGTPTNPKTPLIPTPADPSGRIRL